MSNVRSADVRAAIATETDHYQQSEVREVVAGERSKAHCTLYDLVGSRVCGVTARRTDEGAEITLDGFDRKAPALNALESFLGRPVEFVRDSNHLAPFLAACVVRVVR